MPSTQKSTSNFLSRIWNRQSLVFLFFLMLSASFWAFTAGKEIKEKDFDVDIELVGVPKNVVITTEPPKKVTVTLRDEVFTLLNYKFKHQRNFRTTINWSDVDTSNGHVKIQTSALLKTFYASLRSTTQVLSSRPDVVEFYFNHGLSKKVNVIIQGVIEADSTSYVFTSDVTPRQVIVYGSREALDTVTGAYLEPVNLRGLKEQKSVKVHFKPVKGLKFEPSEVTLNVLADKMMENSVQVPVRGVNFPAGKTLCTFPPKVTVTYNVAARVAKEVTSDAFTIVLNYEELIGQSDNRSTLHLKSLPTGVKNARINPGEVEFIIEEDANYDSEASN